MKFSVNEFRDWNNKKVTLLGMSGVGKNLSVDTVERVMTGSIIPEIIVSANVIWMSPSWT